MEVGGSGQSIGPLWKITHSSAWGTLAYSIILNGNALKICLASMDE